MTFIRIALLSTLAALFFSGCSQPAPETPAPSADTEALEARVESLETTVDLMLTDPELARIAKEYPNALRTDSGLHYIVTKEGAGESTPNTGDSVTAHYTGTLLNGVKFDSSRDRGEPFEFRVGLGNVIKGWDEAFQDMKRGEQRTLIIPSKLGYGARGAGGAIPPNATLLFDVELLDFK